MNYEEFIASKQRTIDAAGFEPGELNPKLFDWQADIVRWACKEQSDQGRARRENADVV